LPLKVGASHDFSMQAAIAETRHWPELDGVRGLAALLVVYAHLFLIWVPNQPSWIFWARTITGQAWTGVYLFFILSGFLIGGILLRNRNAENYYRVFYARRALRIFPLYFCLLGLFFVVRLVFAPAHPEEFAPGPVPLWTYFVFIQNFPMAVTGDWGVGPLGVTWSVALEEQFYLFLPLWIRLIPVRWHVTSFLLLAGIGPVFRAFTPLAHPPFLVPGSSESLFLGVLLAWLFEYKRDVFRSVRWRSVVVGLLAIGAGGMALIVTRNDLGAFAITLTTLFWAAFLWLVLAFMGSPFTAWLRNRFLCWVGKISYGTYLFHPMVSTVVFLLVTGDRPRKELGLTGFGLSSLAFLATLGVASLFFYGMERRLVAMGHHLSYRERAS